MPKSTEMACFWTKILQNWIWALGSGSHGRPGSNAMLAAPKTQKKEIGKWGGVGGPYAQELRVLRGWKSSGRPGRTGAPDDVPSTVGMLHTTATVTQLPEEHTSNRP